jgi:single-strand DNA-binding protein
MLKVELIGNLGRDPEMSYTPDGTAVTKFSVAASDGYKKDEKGNRIDATQWLNVTCWRQQAENAATYLKKGNKVFVRGRLNVRTYTTQAGKQGVSVDVEASEIEYLTPRSTQQTEGNFDDTLAGIADTSTPF